MTVKATSASCTNRVTNQTTANGGVGSGGSTPTDPVLLQETGDELLLETGDSILLDEA